MKNRFKNLSKPLLLDGACGSVLQNSGFEIDPELWSSVLSFVNPDAVFEVHKSYADAGADIITTNTFRTNPEAIKRSSYSYNWIELVNRSVDLAKEAAGAKDMIVAGCNAPAEDCYSPRRTLSLTRLEKNHALHIDELMKAGCDIILNETMGHLDELMIASRYCGTNSIPFITSIYFDENLRLFGGESVEDAITMVMEFEPLLISFNCVNLTAFSNLFNAYKPLPPFGFYLNCGTGKITDPQMHSCITPDEYISGISGFLGENLKMIGACCGSTADHIKKLREFIDEKYRD